MDCISNCSIPTTVQHMIALESVCRQSHAVAHVYTCTVHVCVHARACVIVCDLQYGWRRHVGMQAVTLVVIVRDKSHLRATCDTQIQSTAAVMRRVGDVWITGC
jgi:hypothetical protein